MRSTLRFSSSDLHSPSVVQGLMGLSILLIVLYHCFPVLYKVGTGICWVGVDLWLVVMGYSLTNRLLHIEKKKEKYGRIVRNYLYRFVIPYFLLLIAFFFAFPIFYEYEWIFAYLAYYDHQIWYWLGISNWLVTLHNHWPSVAKPLLDHTWLISLFIQFTVLWSLVVWFCNRKQLICISFALIGLSVLARNVLETTAMNYAVSYVFTFGRWDALGLGALVALLIRDEKGRQLLSKWTPIVVIASSVVILGIIGASKSLTLKHPYFIRIGYTAFAFLFSSLLVYALSETTWLHKMVKTRFLKEWGKYSVGIYVYHWFLYLLLTDWLNKELDAYISHSTLLGLTSSMISKFGIMAVAIGSWYVAERYFVKEIRLEE